MCFLTVSERASGLRLSDPLSETYGLRNVFALFLETQRLKPTVSGDDRPAAVRRLPSVRISECFDRRLHRENLEPSAKPFRHSDKREPPNSRDMDLAS